MIAKLRVLAIVGRSIRDSFSRANVSTAEEERDNENHRSGPCQRFSMTRIARIVVPHAPHHVTQRGNRRERVFLESRGHELYRDWLAESL